MHSSHLLGGVTVLIIAIGAGCASRVATDGAPCPCAPGWVCDKSGGEPGICVNTSLLDAAMPTPEQTQSWPDLPGASLLNVRLQRQ